ncbi:MAG TPA: hypothetical protein P5255_12855 [Phycisphaerae bacterium]|nr:hypothetical protein [Phycisphaerae bacterium]
MLASQHAFFGNILDYAGMFPPAQLPLDASIRNYLQYQSEPESWLLARFICPAGRLHDLRPYVTKHVSGRSPLRISVLGSGGDTAATFLDNLNSDLEATADFRQEFGPAVAVECFEARLPAGDLLEPADLLTMISAAFAAQGLTALPRFFELPATANWPRIANALATVHHSASPEGPGVAGGRALNGLKLRCGGSEPAAIPSAAQVATAIGACLSANVPLKFTAGLHQPVRCVAAALGTRVHGFLNLFAAGILGASAELEYDDLVTIIEEEDVTQFSFSDDLFAWNGAKATVSEIAHARHRNVISFGSCSFDEPRDGLRELGYL